MLILVPTKVVEEAFGHARAWERYLERGMGVSPDDNAEDEEETIPEVPAFGSATLSAICRFWRDPSFFLQNLPLAKPLATVYTRFIPSQGRADVDMFSSWCISVEGRYGGDARSESKPTGVN